MSRRSLYILADELRMNSDTCGLGKFDLNMLRVDAESFESAKKNLRIQKYPAMCGRGLNNSHVVSKKLAITDFAV